MSAPPCLERIGNAELWLGDCREVLPTLPDASVHAVITSPPYWGLRDYGTATWEGGDAGCDHKGGVGASASSGLNGSLAHKDGRVFTPYRSVCGKCGARRIDSQIGLEADPEEYIATMVGVFREVRRILRPDGTLWLNMGDSYSGGKQGRSDGESIPRPRGGSYDVGYAVQRPVPLGYKPKDLLMMPARLALALQADGWWLRSDIIWAKLNPMPESVTDRPTSAHEHVFLLTRSPRYFFDAEAVRDAVGENTHAGYSSNGKKTLANAAEFGVKPSAFDGYRPSSRNIRNVWEIATSPFSAAHFATFPPALVERCIRAGTSERGCCAACGAPWVRVTNIERHPTRPGNPIKADSSRNDGGRAERIMSEFVTTGWRPSCACKTLRCVACCAVLGMRHENRKARTANRVPDVQRDVPAVGEASPVLQPPLLRTATEETDADPLLAMRDGILASELPAEAVFRAVRAEMDGAEPLDDEGLDNHQQGLQADSEARPSELNRGWLRDGASARDGEEAGQASNFGRGGASQEWRPTGQPDRQSGTDGKASARRPSQADLLCDLPPLPANVSDSGKCPHCGSDTEWTTPNTVPATVLDCFAGAGTTLLVADRLQRRAVGIELNGDYTRMAMARVVDDAPLFTAWPPAEDAADARMADLFEARVAEAAE